MSHPLSRPYHCAAYKGRSNSAIERAMLLPLPSLSQISLAQCGAMGAIGKQAEFHLLSLEAMDLSQSFRFSRFREPVKIGRAGQ